MTFKYIYIEDSCIHGLFKNNFFLLVLQIYKIFRNAQVRLDIFYFKNLSNFLVPANEEKRINLEIKNVINAESDPDLLARGSATLLPVSVNGTE